MLGNEERAQKSLLNALFRVSLPLARTLLQAGVTYREFEGLFREAFVMAASRIDGIRGRETNTSRVAHMTGLTRKEVRRIKEMFADIDGHQSDWKEISRPGDILHGWYSDPEFLTNEGAPRKLRISGEFESLVRKYGGDIPPGAIRKELKRVNAIVEHDDSTVEPLKPYYVPIEALDRLLTSLNFSLFGLLSTVSHNSDPKRTQSGRLERFVSSDRVPLARLVEARDELRRAGEQFSLHVDDILSKYEVTETDQDTTYLNAGMGVFYYEEDFPS